MDIAKLRGEGGEGRAHNPQPLNRLTKNLASVITLAITPRMPKLKTNAPLGTWRHMHKISTLCILVLVCYPILSFFCDPKFCSRPETKP